MPYYLQWSQNTECNPLDRLPVMHLAGESLGAERQLIYLSADLKNLQNARPLALLTWSIDMRTPDHFQNAFGSGDDFSLGSIEALDFDLKIRMICAIKKRKENNHVMGLGFFESTIACKLWQ